VTRRNVSTLRATVPCASVACSSSSRFSGVAADLKFIDSVLELWAATISSLPEKNWRADYAIVSPCLCSFERAGCVREKQRAGKSPACFSSAAIGLRKGAAVLPIVPPSVGYASESKWQSL
jgi:hypothetical protein